jgi:hypothetical protein
MGIEKLEKVAHILVTLKLLCCRIYFNKENKNKIIAKQFITVEEIY